MKIDDSALCITTRKVDGGTLIIAVSGAAELFEIENFKREIHSLRDEILSARVVVFDLRGLEYLHICVLGIIAASMKEKSESAQVKIIHSAISGRLITLTKDLFPNFMRN